MQVQVPCYAAHGDHAVVLQPDVHAVLSGLLPKARLLPHAQLGMEICIWTAWQAHISKTEESQV